MKTAELTGALLDYWTARAEGVPAEQLEIRPVQRPDTRTPDTICVRRNPVRDPIIGHDEVRMQYSTSWHHGGPLFERHGMGVVKFYEPVDGPIAVGFEWAALSLDDKHREDGPTPLIAICRAVVRAAFGDEVEDLPC